MDQNRGRMVNHKRNNLVGINARKPIWQTINSVNKLTSSYINFQVLSMARCLKLIIAMNAIYTYMTSTINALLIYAKKV